jgi:hypothetical protein
MAGDDRAAGEPAGALLEQAGCSEDGLAIFEGECGLLQRLRTASDQARMS